MRAPLLVAIAVASACTSPQEQKERKAQVARAAVATEAAKAAVASSIPASGKWDEGHLVERLVRAGLAPQAVQDAKGEPYWGVPVHVYHLGNATLHAYVYPDSGARRKVTDALDSLTAAPRGATSSYAAPLQLILQNNLAAVLVGGSARQQDRVSLALTAGLPVSSRP